MKKLEFMRERPIGMTPFAVGVVTLLGVATSVACGIDATPGVWAGLVAFGLVMTAFGVHLFRQPHRLELDGREVRVKGRFGSPRRWASARLKEAPSPARIALEVGVLVAAVTPVVILFGRASPLQLLMAVAYSVAYARWRLAPRAQLEAQGVTTTIRLDGLPGAAEAIAAA